MELSFVGKYKSITNFEWKDIPRFVIITGPNGTGKSQLLELINNSVTNKRDTTARVTITNANILPHEVTFLQGEWKLENTWNVSLSTIQQQMESHYQNFLGGSYTNPNNLHSEGQIRLYYTCQNIIRQTGKSNFRNITREEFFKYFPQYILEQESQMSQKIGEIFYDYRLSEIELKAKKVSDENIIKEIGEKPWVVLREIIKEARLPFDINDPSNNGIRDSFQFKLSHQVLSEEINFNDLSSGEKVLLSLVFYLYNSQEKKVFPKLMLLDEPDAHLHPSMSQQFLNVIKNVLVDKYGVQVIMTTHSPSTVILAPKDSIYEMSRTEPRIKKSPSKNHAVSLLTAGLVYVGEGTRYFLVEDVDDVNFYSYAYTQLTTMNIIDSDIPLVFIPASTKNSSGGKSVVQDWVSKLQESGLVNIINGLIDADYNNVVSKGVYKINRYSIENYLADPILVYAALMDKEQNPDIQNINLSFGEEYKLKTLPQTSLQKVADVIFALVEPELPSYFDDFNMEEEVKRVEVRFSEEIRLQYPKWLLSRKGKTIINGVYQKVFSSMINYTSLNKALKRINMFPYDLVEKLEDIKRGTV